MIKKGANIRSFTTYQTNMLTKIGLENEIKTVPKILFFCVEKFYDCKADLARKDRIIQLNKNKISDLKEQIELLKLKINDSK